MSKNYDELDKHLDELIEKYTDEPEFAKLFIAVKQFKEHSAKLCEILNEILKKKKSKDSNE